MKALGCLAALLLPAPLSPPTLASPIPKIVCPIAGGFRVGSAFRIGPKLLVSVRHVTNYPKCTIDGEPVTVRYSSPTSDFSILTESRAGKSLTVDCGGFVAGKKYLALGHARGLDQIVGVELIATGIIDRFGFSVLRGIFTAVPGQSGGPVVDMQTGKVVGTVNVFDMIQGLTGSVALKGTLVCNSEIA